MFRVMNHESGGVFFVRDERESTSA